MVVADQNGRGNAGKKNCRSEELVFLESTMKGSRRTRLQMQSIRHPKISLQFSYHWFLQNSLIFLFSLKNMTCNMQATKLLLFNLLLSCCFPWPTADTAHRSGLRTSSKYILCSWSKRNTNLLVLPAILFQKIKTRCEHIAKIGKVKNSG